MQEPIDDHFYLRIMPSATEGANVTERTFNLAADNACGIFWCLCFLVGTLGNTTSFIYFKSKKRNISSVIYMFKTANDIVISITALPVGISFLSKRSPGIIFGSKWGCVAWYCIWEMAVPTSVFLVVCLSVARTISLLRPFKLQKIRYLVVVVVVYIVVSLTRIVVIYAMDNLGVAFIVYNNQCRVFFNCMFDKEQYIAMYISNNIEYTAPVLVVAVSCVISAVVLTRRNKTVQQRELQESRKRATVTILLFALLYGICNIPMVVHYIIFTIFLSTKNRERYIDLYQFDSSAYFRIAGFTLFLAGNSAANPVFYYWRMPALREYTVTEMRELLRLKRRVMGPAADNREHDNAYPANRIVQNYVALQVLSFGPTNQNRT